MSDIKTIDPLLKKNQREKIVGDVIEVHLIKCPQCSGAGYDSGDCKRCRGSCVLAKRIN